MVTYQYKVASRLPGDGGDPGKIQGTDKQRHAEKRDRTVYKVGDTVPADGTATTFTCLIRPRIHSSPWINITRAYTKHNLGTGKIDMSAYDFTVGDPTTYKSSFLGHPAL